MLWRAFDAGLAQGRGPVSLTRLRGRAYSSAVLQDLRQRGVRRIAALALALLCAVPLALSAHHHDEPAENGGNQCSACVVASQVPLAVPVAIVLVAPALHFAAVDIADEVARAHCPSPLVLGRAPPVFLPIFV